MTTEFKTGQIVAFTYGEYDSYSIYSNCEVLKDFNLQDLHLKYKANIFTDKKLDFPEWLEAEGYVKSRNYTEVNLNPFNDGLVMVVERE